MLRISILLETLRRRDLVRLDRATVACSAASRRAMRSAAALALSRIGIDCTRPKQAPTMNNSAVVVLAIEEPPSESLKFGRDEHHRAEQDVHRDLRGDDHLEGFGLGADFDVGRGLRHLDGIVEQIVAARAVEP